MVIVKLVKVGSYIKEVPFESNTTLQNLLDSVEEKYVSNCITRGGIPLIPESTIYDGDTIYIMKSMKGNLPFEAKFIILGTQEIINLPVDDGYTIKMALDQLDAAGRERFYNADGKAVYEFRVEGVRQSVGDNHIIARPAGDSIRIICAKRLKGNEQQ